jgi:hypothetical protein
MSFREVGGIFTDGGWQPLSLLHRHTVCRSGSAARPARRQVLSGGPALLPGSAPLGTSEAYICRTPATIFFLSLPHASPVSTSEAGKQVAAPEDRFKPLISSRKFGAGEGPQQHEIYAINSVRYNVGFGAVPHLVPRRDATSALLSVRSAARPSPPRNVSP